MNHLLFLIQLKKLRPLNDSMMKKNKEKISDDNYMKINETESLICNIFII